MISLFQHPEMMTPSVYSGIQPPEMWTHSVYIETSLFQYPEMMTSLYTVESLYSNPLKLGHLCIQWNTSLKWEWDISQITYDINRTSPSEMKATPVIRTL